MRRKIFNNEKVSGLLAHYARHRKDTVLRDRILKLTLPLIDAAISRKRLYKHKEDLKQECVVKLMYALPKYDPHRGNAFAFLWTTICNTCTTQDQRLTDHGLSLSDDEDVKRQAESNGHSVFQTPENKHILNAIGQSLYQTLTSLQVSTNGHGRIHRRVCRKIKKFVVSGELFYDRHLVVKKLKRLGLGRKEVQFYVDRTLVMVREQLLKAKENASAIKIHEIGTSIPKDSDTSVS